MPPVLFTFLLPLRYRVKTKLIRTVPKGEAAGGNIFTAMGNGISR